MSNSITTAPIVSTLAPTCLSGAKIVVCLLVFVSMSQSSALGFGGPTAHKGYGLAGAHAHFLVPGLGPLRFGPNKYINTTPTTGQPTSADQSTGGSSANGQSSSADSGSSWSLQTATGPTTGGDSGGTQTASSSDPSSSQSSAGSDPGSTQSSTGADASSTPNATNAKKRNHQGLMAAGGTLAFRRAAQPVQPSSLQNNVQNSSPGSPFQGFMDMINNISGANSGSK